jgi:hypothetical protein
MSATPSIHSRPSSRGNGAPIPVFGAVALLLLAGCAEVVVTPLNPDGTPKEGNVAKGLRYYMPAPYLLVAELPPSATDASTPKAPVPRDPAGDSGAVPPATSGAHDLAADADRSPAHGAGGAGGQGGGGGGDGKGSKDSSDGNNQDNSTSASGAGSAATDTSFSGATTQYVIKIVYLPDLSQPMAMTGKTGLFGTSEFKPTLADGWMLTSLDATSDSKVSDTLTALGSIVGGVTGASSKAAKGAATGGAGGAPGVAAAKTLGDLKDLYTADRHILRPGLYRFVYDKDGKLTGIEPVTLFTGSSP